MTKSRNIGRGGKRSGAGRPEAILIPIAIVVAIFVAPFLLISALT